MAAATPISGTPPSHRRRVNEPSCGSACRPVAVPPGRPGRPGVRTWSPRRPCTIPRRRRRRDLRPPGAGWSPAHRGRLPVGGREVQPRAGAPVPCRDGAACAHRRPAARDRGLALRPRPDTLGRGFDDLACSFRYSPSRSRSRPSTCGSRDPPGGAVMSPTFSAPGFADDLNPDLRNRRNAVIDTEFDRPPAPRSPVRQHGRTAETVRTRGRRPEAAAARATAGGVRPPDDRPREAADLTEAGARGDPGGSLNAVNALQSADGLVRRPARGLRPAVRLQAQPAGVGPAAGIRPDPLTEASGPAVGPRGRR